MTPKESKEFYTVAELAEWLEVDPMTVYRLVSRGDLAAHKIGRALRFRRVDVEAFLAKARSGEKGQG